MASIGTLPFQILKRFQQEPILLAPMPKTASNTLLQRLYASIDSQILRPKTSGGVGHMVVDDWKLWGAYKSVLNKKRPIVYQHMLPLIINKKRLGRFLNTADVPKVVVSIRNIYDVAISCANHQQKTRGPWWINRDENDFFGEEKADAHSHFWNALICLKFYASWYIAHEKQEWDVKFVHYDDIINAPEQTILDVLSFYGIAEAGLEQKNLRDIQDNVNKGVSGRGAELDPYFKDVLMRYASTFKNIDFSPIGL